MVIVAGVLGGTPDEHASERSTLRSTRAVAILARMAGESGALIAVCPVTEGRTRAMSGYVFQFQGTPFDPDGQVDMSGVDVADHNRRLSYAEAEFMRTAAVGANLGDNCMVRCRRLK